MRRKMRYLRKAKLSSIGYYESTSFEIILNNMNLGINRDTRMLGPLAAIKSPPKPASVLKIGRTGVRIVEDLGARGRWF